MEACRRDQFHLIEQVLSGMEDKTNEQVAEFFNGVTDSMGNYALHICAQYGSCTFSPSDIQVVPLVPTTIYKCQPELTPPSL